MNSAWDPLKKQKRSSHQKKINKSGRYPNGY